MVFAEVKLIYLVPVQTSEAVLDLRWIASNFSSDERAYRTEVIVFVTSNNTQHNLTATFSCRSTRLTNIMVKDIIYYWNSGKVITLWAGNSK